MPPEKPKERLLDIVAIGASAGGVEALSSLFEHLPRNLPATILVVLHRPPSAISHLPAILSRQTDLQVIVPHGQEPLQYGLCFVGPPDQHLTVGPDQRIRLLPDSTYRGHTIDELFCSLARHAGERTIAVVLSGVQKDGALGMKAIKEAGGAALVQSPEEAIYPDMPRGAMKYDGPIDFVGPVNALAREISRMVGHKPTLGLSS
jgi:two-component system chemotaxis response regulator CheB